LIWATFDRVQLRLKSELFSFAITPQVASFFLRTTSKIAISLDLSDDYRAQISNAGFILLGVL
jgi:hypothetical protein